MVPLARDHPAIGTVRPVRILVTNDDGIDSVGLHELARALVERYIEMDTQVFRELSERADSLSENPLQRTLIFLNLFAEMVAGMTEVPRLLELETSIGKRERNGWLLALGRTGGHQGRFLARP